MTARLRDPPLLPVAAATALLCTVETWALGPLSWIYGYGSGLETIPTFLALSHEGRNTAAWAPFVAGGVDRMAFWGNAAPLSIEYLLFANLPVWLANGLHRFLQYFVGVYFTARVLTDVFRQPRSWAAFGGIAFACFSYFTVGQLFTLPGVPLLIWSLERLCRREAGAVLFLLAGAALSFTTTFTFGVPYYIAFATLWLLTGRTVRGIGDALKIGAFFVGLTVPTGLQLWAAAANASASQRAGWAIDAVSFSFGGLFYTQLQYDLFNQDKLLSAITQVLPASVFVAGAAVLLLGWWRGNRPDRIGRHFLRVALLFILFAQRWLWLGLQHVAVLVLPWAGGVYMGRFFQIPASFLIALGLTFAAQLVWRRLAGLGRRAFAAAAAGLALLFIVQPKIFLAVPLGIGDWGEANYRVAALDDLMRAAPATEPFRVASVLPLQPAYAYAQGLEAADGWANIYPAIYRDLWLKVLEPLFAELPLTAKAFGVDSGRSVDAFVFLGLGLGTPGTGLLPGEDVATALRDGFDIDRRFRIDLLRLLNIRYLLSEYPLRGSGLRPVHAPEPWPVRLVARDPNTGLAGGAFPPLNDMPEEAVSPGSVFRAFGHANERKRTGKDIFIYEIAGAVPRVWLASEVRIVETPAAALAAVAALPGNDIGRIAIVAAGDAPAATGIVAVGDAAITAYAADRMTVSVKTPDPALLVVANTWSPYWTASVDGKPASVVKVNYAQIGVALAPGNHAVELRYRPPYARHWLHS